MSARAITAIVQACILAVALGPAASAGQTASDPAHGRWVFIAGTYVWASGLDGRIGVGGNIVHVDISFRDLLKHIDGALFLPLELRKGRWGAVVEIIEVKISDQGGTPGPLFESVSVRSEQTTIEASPTYRLLERHSLAVDALAGLRLWHLSSTLDFDAADGRELSFGFGEQWVDPIVGGRAFRDLGPRWFLQARADIGGFGVGSKFTWQLIGLIAYRPGRDVTIRAGYRQLDVDFEDDQNRFLYDVGSGGWIAGVTIRL